jgi:hypothetical protein
MRRVFILVLMCIGFGTVKAQDSVQEIKIYNARIIFKTDLLNSVRGTLYDVTDTSIVISPRILSKGFSEDNLYLKKVYYNDIKTIKIRKKGNMTEGLIFGALAGGLAGFFLGYSGGDEPPGFISITAEGKGAALGLVGASLGGLIGLAIGSVSIKIPINGSLDSFFKSRLRIKNLAIKK